MISRDECNNGWQHHGKLHGVPITLKVPTHVKVYVYETYYLKTVSAGNAQRTERIKLPYTLRDFSQDFIYTEKIFTVDFKRPAAGTFNLRLDMTEDQYIQNVAHDVTDTTIQAVDGLIKKLAPSGLIPSLASGDASGNNPLKNLYPVKSVVAVGVFEIDAPDFEQRLTAFINLHLTQSHDAFVTDPSVAAIQRIGLENPPQPALPGLEFPGCPPLQDQLAPPFQNQLIPPMQLQEQAVPPAPPLPPNEDGGAPYSESNNVSPSSYNWVKH
jgi:hypothetical protein